VWGEGFDDAVVEAVDPAVDGDLLAAVPGVFDDGGACDMAGLGEHIEFAESVGGGLGREGVEFIPVGAVEVADAGEPVVDDPVAEVFKGSDHAAAAVVTADDHVADLEDIDRVLQDSEQVEIGFGDDIGDIAVDEDFAGCEAGDLVGGHAAVGTTDPEILGCLLVGEIGKESGVFGFDRGCPVAVFFQKVGECVHVALSGIQADWQIFVHHAFECVFFALAGGVSGIGMTATKHGIFWFMELSSRTAGGCAPGGDPCRIA